MERIYSKLGVTNRASAAMRAMQYGLAGRRSAEVEHGSGAGPACVTAPCDQVELAQHDLRRRQ